MKFNHDYFTRESFKVKQKWKTQKKKKKTSVIWNQKRNHDPTRRPVSRLVRFAYQEKKVPFQEV